MNSTLYRSTPLQHCIVNNAISSPFSYLKGEQTISGCLYDNGGKLISYSQRTSGKAGDRLTNTDPSQLDPQQQSQWSTETVIEEDCIYLGHLMGHYGHFITETLASFWALPLVSPNTRVIFHPFIFGNTIRPFMEPFLEAFDLCPSRITILKEPTRFRCILVPERSFHLNHYVSGQFADIVQRLNTALDLPRRPSRRIFLSRSRLKAIARSYSNADATDALMAQLGLEIIHPQELDAREQLALYAATELVVGFSGSALHNCLFMPSTARLIEIGDRRNPAKPLLTQQMCDLTSGLKSQFLPAWPQWSHLDENYNLEYLATALGKLEPELTFQGTSPGELTNLV